MTEPVLPGKQTLPRPPLGLQVAVFGMAGPLFGDAAFALAPAIASWSASLPALSELPGQLALCAVIFLVGIPFAYILGLLPAVLSGLLSAALLRVLPSGRSNAATSLLAGAWCGAVSGILLLVVLWIGDRMNGIPRTDAWSENGLSLSWILLIPSVVAGSGCQWLVFRWQRRQARHSAAGESAPDP